MTRVDKIIEIVKLTLLKIAFFDCVITNYQLDD